MTENEGMNEEAPAPEQTGPVKRPFSQVLAEMEQVIKSFCVTPQVVNVAFVKFNDPAGQEILLAISCFRVATSPDVDMSEALTGIYEEPARRYAIHESARTEALANGATAQEAAKAGIEALFAYMKETGQTPGFEEQPAEEGESADAEEGDVVTADGKTIIIGG